MAGRRRGTAGIVGLAVFVLLAGIGVVLWGVLRTDSSGAAPADVTDQTDAARGPGQMNLDLSPTSAFVATLRVSDSSRQMITVQSLTAGTYAGQVSAYDPGTFDPATLKTGQHTIVAGQDAWYLAQYVFPGDGTSQRTAALGWQDPSGMWLLVYADTALNDSRVFDPEQLRRLAETVLISPPHDLRAPFHLGWTPAGLTMTYLAVSDSTGVPGHATLGLSAAGRKPSNGVSYRSAPDGIDLSVSAAAPDKAWPAEKAKLTGATTIGGQPAWLNGRDLVLDGGQCIVRVHSAAQRSRDDLDKLIQELRVGDCSQPDGWAVPTG
jgi:hypothetical protein